VYKIVGQITKLNFYLITSYIKSSYINWMFITWTSQIS